MTLYLMTCVAVFLYGWHGFTQAGTTRALIFCAILMLVAYETTVLVKLWYWVVNNKLAVLKEIKLLRLSLPPGAEDALAPDAPGPSGRREHRWMMAGIVLTGVCVSTFLNARPEAIAQLGLTSTAYVTLTEQGDAEVVASIAYRNTGPMPLARTTFHAPVGQQIRWYDEQGRALSTSAEPADTRLRYAIELGAPVLPDEWVRYRRVSRIEGAATRETDSWIYQADTSYGNARNTFDETVKIPAGATVLAAEPEPAAIRTGPDGAQILRFAGRRGANEPFAYIINYRLPAGGPAAAATPAESENRNPPGHGA
jgi:hypothetical protein